MNTITLPVNIVQKTKKKFAVEIDYHGFERLADSLGLFRREFLESIDRAELDIRLGRVKKLHSLHDLRARK